MDWFEIVKWLHILSSTVLFGTGIGTAFQMLWAMRSNDSAVIARVAGGVVVADWIFTTPAGIMQPATGLWLMHLAGYDPFDAWLVASYGLYAVALLCWLPVLHLQIRIRDLARIAASAGQPLPAAARRAFAIWFALGWPAFAALMAVFWLMVARPNPLF
jgi:uncharacterized membrane protein